MTDSEEEKDWDDIDTDEMNDLVFDRHKDYTFSELFIPRAEWNALPATSPGEPRGEPFRFVLTGFTGTNPCWNDMSCFMGAQGLQKFYMVDWKARDLPYNFLIGGNGTIFECRGWNEVPKVPDRYSHAQSITLFIGFFGKQEEAGCVTDGMTSSRDELIRQGMEMSHVHKTVLQYQSLHTCEVSMP